jgi:hypothetical protein
LRGRWQQGGKSIGFAGLPIGQTATAKSEILTPHHPLMLTDEVLIPPTPTGGRSLADPSGSKNAAAAISNP